MVRNINLQRGKIPTELILSFLPSLQGNFCRRMTGTPTLAQLEYSVPLSSQAGVPGTPMRDQTEATLELPRIALPFSIRHDGLFRIPQLSTSDAFEVGTRCDVRVSHDLLCLSLKFWIQSRTRNSCTWEARYPAVAAFISPFFLCS